MSKTFHSLINVLCSSDATTTEDAGREHSELLSKTDGPNEAGFNQNKTTRPAGLC